MDGCEWRVDVCVDRWMEGPLHPFVFQEHL